ncbi:SH3 domain-containing kinase-binding protein 1-like isoform X3 [Anneissia japonica]|uniref:SH3 domain-containing kinase-binding protein 1-like isoform X3 n=1 Tax=Anneissia japonica TaxID=1529436 RepID=UPI001425A6B8|nr:SH3 domain-containing kinase-binding protein 1-like isoform X3 [Anneissia japonica]
MENQSGLEAEVQFSYDAVNSDELDLNVGDIIKNINMMDGGWWEGEINGKRGMFPDNFVKVLEKKKEEPRPLEASTTTTKSKAPGPPVNGEVHHAKESASSSNAGVSLRENKPSRENRARVTYSYVPMNEDELKLLPNDVILDVVEVEDGWCEGSLNGRRGMFPSNFVSIIKEEDDEPQETASKNDTSVATQPIAIAASRSDTPTASSSVSNTPTSQTNVQTKPVKLPGAIGFGVDIFKDAKPLRRRELGPMKSSEVKNGSSNLELMKKRNSLKKPLVPSEELALPLKQLKTVEDQPKLEPIMQEVKAVEKAKVVYDYTPENSDELALKEGDIITVLDKESVDSGWWYGECHGKQGMFPDNFVLLIPNEPERPKKESVPLRPPAPNKPPNRPPSIEAKSIHKPLPKSLLDSSVPPVSPLKPPVKSDEPSKSATGPSRPAKPIQRKPPPIKNKPAPSKQVLPPSNTKEQDKKPTAMAHNSGDSFDDIKSNNKLNHPNLSRPKTPNKRPPSVYKAVEGPKRSNTISRLSTIASNDGDESSKVPWQHEMRSKSLKRQSTLPAGLKNLESEELAAAILSSPMVTKNKTQMATVAPTQPEKPIEESPSVQTHKERDTDAPKDQEPTSESAFELELKNEIKSLKETMKKDMKALKDMMTSMRSDLRKEMKSLMEEVDEEKKLRMNMQVELDRMKKLVKEMN